MNTRCHTSLNLTSINGGFYFSLLFIFKECILETASRHLIFHGALLLLIALLYGAPYARAIKSGASAQVVNSWRVAHQSITLGSLLMFSIAAVLPTLLVPVGVKWLIATALIISAYAFAVATPLAAITKDRGLASDG